MNIFNTNIQDILVMIPALLIALTFHEYAHAFVADKLGDKTPKYQGRLTLNPLVHIDLIGFLMFIIIGFGWAKPVQTNPRNFKNYRNDDLKVSAAGPVMNLIIAFIFALVVLIFEVLTPAASSNTTVVDFIDQVLLHTVSLNCILFILNLLPIPGFDGFHILSDIFPRQIRYNSSYSYIIQIVLILVIMGSLGYYLITLPALRIADLFYTFWAKIIGFFI